MRRFTFTPIFSFLSLALLALLVLTPLSCGDESDDPGDSREAGSYALVGADQWITAGETDDPFRASRPDQIECPRTAYGSELIGTDLTFWVDTGVCDYLAVRQPALAEVRAGDIISIRVSHFELTGPDGSQAHLGIAFNDTVVWERTISIPADQNTLSDSVASPVDLAQSELITFQVSNHGANNYNLREISAEVAP